MFQGLLESKRAGVKHIVKISHLRADASPGVTITRRHRQVEKVIEESGIKFTFLRPNSFMQNFVNLYGPSIRSMNHLSWGREAKVRLDQLQY